MSSEPTEPTRRGHSLALRLTLWYAGIFASACALAFAFVASLAGLLWWETFGQ